MSATEKKISKILNSCRSGVLTESERDRLLCELDIEPDLLDFLSVLPEGAIKILKQRASMPYASIDDVPTPWTPIQIPSFNAQSGKLLLVPSTDTEEIHFSRRQKIFHARLRLRNHFCPDIPLPPYQQRISLGKVRETIDLSGSIAISGPHPAMGALLGHSVELHLPTGSITVTQIVSSTLGVTSRGHQVLLVLSDNITTTDQVPVGTEVIVVRSEFPRLV